MYESANFAYSDDGRTISQANGPRVRWEVADGGNGHSYQVITSEELLSGPRRSMSWTQANVDAQARGGYLATLKSVRENEFVFSLVDSPEYWFAKSPSIGARFGPWLGGWQPAPSSDPTVGWEWVTGEPFEFTNWHEGEPNDLGPEDFLQYFAIADSTGERSSFWNDAANLHTEAMAYVLEIVPEPCSTLIALVAIYVGISCRRPERNDRCAGRSYGR